MYGFVLMYFVVFSGQFLVVCVECGFSINMMVNLEYSNWGFFLIFFFIVGDLSGIFLLLLYYFIVIIECMFFKYVDK